MTLKTINKPMYKTTQHLTRECYLAYMDATLFSNDLVDLDSICEQLWAEIKIMRTLRVKDIKRA